MLRSVHALALLACAHSQCILPPSLSDFGPVLNAFSATGLTLTSPGAAPASLAGQGGSATIAFSHTSRANAYAIECGQSLDLNFITSMAAMTSSGPGVGAAARCTLLSVNPGAADMGGGTYANFSTLPSATACRAPSSLAAFTSPPAGARPAAMLLGSPGSTLGYTEPCAGLAAVPPASLAALRGVLFLGSAAGLTVNISNSSLLLPEPAATFAPLGTSLPYSILTCIKSAALLADGVTVAVQSYGDTCAYLSPNYAASFLSATTTWTSCVMPPPAFPAKFSDVAATTARFTGAFVNAPPAGAPGAGAAPPPPPPQQLVVQTVPVLSFSTTLAFPGLANKSPSDVAATVLTPCGVASLRAGYAAGLSLPLASVLLSRITLSDSTFLDLSPSSAGNVAAGACAPGSARALSAAESDALLLSLQGQGQGRRLQPPTGSISVGTTVVNPPPALSTSFTGASAPPVSVSVASLGGAAPAAAPTGASTGNATLALPLPPLVRIRPYVPSALINFWHAIPRGASSNVFDTSNMDLPSIIKCGQSLGAKASCPNNYIFGALAPGLALIVVGILALILWLLSYCCACIRCCWRCKPRDRSAEGLKGRMAKVAAALPIVRLVLGIINAALIFAALAYLPLFPKGLLGIGDTASGLVSTLGDIGALLTASAGTQTIRLFDGTTTPALTPPIRAIGDAADALGRLYAATGTAAYAQCPAAPPPTSTCSSNFVINLLSGASAGMGAAKGADMSAAAGGIVTATAAMQGSLGSLGLNAVAGYITQASLPLFAIIAIMCVLQALWFCRCYFACCMYKVLAPISIICASCAPFRVACRVPKPSPSAAQPPFPFDSRAAQALCAGPCRPLDPPTHPNTQHTRARRELYHLYPCGRVLFVCRAGQRRVRSAHGSHSQGHQQPATGAARARARIPPPLAPSPALTAYPPAPAAAQLAYYLTCATTPGLSPPDFLSFITSALTKLSSVVVQIGKITDMANGVGSGPTAGYGPLVSSGVAAADLTAASSSAAAAINSISIIPNTVFSCVQVDALFSSLFDSLCNGTVSAAAGIAQCLVAAAALMLLQMAIGIDICCYHPGDKTAWVDKGEMEEGRNCCGLKKRGAASVRGEGSPSPSAGVAEGF